MKTLGLATITLSALLLTGCGGGGSKHKTKMQEITERDGVFIIHSTKESMCSLFTDAVKKESGVKDVIFDSPANTVNCSTYGKVEGSNCENETLANMIDAIEGSQDIEAIEDASKACVIGMNKNI